MSAHSPPETASFGRFVWLDRARGTALVAMIVFHAFWDALFLGAWTWTPQRDALLSSIAPFIAGAFIAISGSSLAFAAGQTNGPLLRSPAFRRRMLLLGGSALLISVVTTFALPSAPIYFGVLHHIFVASLLLALLATVHPFFALALAAGVLLANDAIALEAFNAPALIWLGLGTRAPITADWVPLLPWLAVGCIGFALTRAWLLPWLEGRSKLNLPERQEGFLPDPLAWMGRRSLAIYLIHQPVLIGILSAFRWVHPAPIG